MTPFLPAHYYPEHSGRERAFMPIYDLSVPLRAEMPTYPGDPEIKILQWSTLESGANANVSQLNFGAHTGTHVDAPAHFLRDGEKVEFLPLDVLIGKVEVVEVPNDFEVIRQDFLQEVWKAGTRRVLFKTRNSRFWADSENSFREDYTYLDLSGAQFLVEQGICLVGIDYLSIEQFGTARFETHRLLLSHKVVIIEGLNLDQIAAGEYELICLPLRIRGGSGDGAPARVVLRTLD
ncbi:MAG: cyclase family protein [Pyrinomonadaceae bacterium]